MNYIISGKNIEVTDGLKTAIYDKLGRLEKFFLEDTDVQVTLSVEKERQKIEVTIPMKGHIIRAEQASDDMYVSIDLVVEVIERQVTRYKKKIVDKEQNAAYIQSDFFDVDEDEDDEIIYSADSGNDLVVGSTDEVLEAGFVIDEDSPEDIMDVFGSMDSADDTYEE